VAFAVIIAGLVIYSTTRTGLQLNVDCDENVTVTSLSNCEPKNSCVVKASDANSKSQDVIFQTNVMDENTLESGSQGCIIVNINEGNKVQ
jgi:hypothetical protein